MVVGCQPFLLFLRQLLNCIFTSHGVLSILKDFIVSQSHRAPAFCVFCPFSAVVSHYTHLKIHRPSCIQRTIRAAHLGIVIRIPSADHRCEAKHSLVPSVGKHTERGTPLRHHLPPGQTKQESGGFRLGQYQGNR